MEKLVSAYPISQVIPVAWGEMDSFRHVNNIVYFRYFETARMAYFEQIGIIPMMEETGIGPILASTQCRYKFPLTYPDSVSVCARVTEIGTSDFIMQYAVISHRHKKVAAEGEGRIVMLNYKNHSKVPIPEKILEHIHHLERG